MTTTAQRRWWPSAVVILVALVAALGAGAGAWLVLGGNRADEQGAGTFTLSLAKATPASRGLHAHAGEALGFGVRPDQKQLRYRVAIAVDGSTARAIDRAFDTASEPYDASDYADVYGPARPAGSRLLFAGRRRGAFAFSFVAPATGTYSLVVRADGAGQATIDLASKSKPNLPDRPTPRQVAAIGRDPSYREFFTSWRARIGRDYRDFTDFTDTNSVATEQSS